MAIAESFPPTLPAEPGARGFQKGHQKLGGRQKGSRNRFGGDLREAVVAAIQATGFIEKDDKGKRSHNATSFEPADAFIDDTAKKTGKHRATVARKAARAKKVAVLPDIVGTSLDTGAEIDALAKLPVEKQRSLAEAAKRGENVSAISARKACGPEAPKTSDGTGKARSTPSRRKKLI
jgi:hypothetical protein